LARWLVGASALEGLEHQIAHGADVSFDAFKAVSFGLSIFSALAVNAGALSEKFAVEPGQPRDN
jgi:hypothetical protein